MLVLTEEHSTMQFQDTSTANKQLTMMRSSFESEEKEKRRGKNMVKKGVYIDKGWR